jgi:hypothetical protein
MDRRQFTRHTAATLAAAWSGLLVTGTLQHARALSLSELSNQDAASGIRAALEKGAQAAVALLGQPGGFLDNPKVRIPLPNYLEQAAGVLKMTGQSKRIDELVVGMNRAAEAAVPMGQELLVKAVKSMTVQDAKQILSGSENAVTQFFADKTRAPLGQSFMPVVSKAVGQVGLAKTYDRVAGQASGMGLIKNEDASIEQYVTGKTLDGLYAIIGEEERKIRQDPVGTGSALLQKVFGAEK